MPGKHGGRKLESSYTPIKNKLFVSKTNTQLLEKSPLKTTWHNTKTPTGGQSEEKTPSVDDAGHDVNFFGAAAG